MDLPDVIETFKNGLMHVCLWVLAALAVCALLLLASKRKQVRPVFAHIPPVQCVVLLAVMAVCTLFSGKNTNSPPAGIMSPILPGLTGGTPVVPVAVTPEEIAQGWRIVAETNCDANVYAMPEGVSPSFNWHRRGTFGEWSRLALGDFAFPLGTNSETFSSFSVFSDGRIRPTPRDAAHEICAVGVPMLAMQGASRFWWADSARSASAPYQSKLLTWENFFLNADTNTPVNAQIELFTNGDFITRSNAFERIHRRVAYFDWDGDGLENSVDPEPLVAGADAHGTNAEWYNVVCSNVLEAVAGDGGDASGTLRPTLLWLGGVNSNAYYFVDVVATNGPAPIYFTGDRESRLGNPVVVARAFETNHVPLLIGIGYAVTSPVPFSVSIPDEGFATITTNGVSNYAVQWPLDFVFTESIEGSSRIYSVTVEPYDPGGVLTWESGGMRSGASYGCGCGCLGCVGYSVLFSCSLNCTCDGECQAVGDYTFEDALFAVTGGVCRCGFDDPVEGETEVTNPPPISVSFSKQVVIFEDAYEDEPGVMKPKRSSRVRITVDAYGGAFGGSLSVSSANLDKLTPVGGGVALPIIGHVLAAEGHFHVTGVYEGAEASGSNNDVTLSGTFTEYFTSQQHQSSNSLTVVRVELTPCAIAPENPSTHRHLLGVGEIVNCLQYPSSPSVTWQSFSGWTVSNSLGVTTFTAPLLAAENGVCATCGGQTYSPRVRVIEPDGIVAENAAPVRYGVPKGEAGGIGMKLDLYVMPKTVSFSNIAMQETPCLTGTHTGYFDNPEFADEWYHWTNHGAGEWHNIGGDNFFFEDYPRVHGAWPRMMDDGTITTNKSYGWQDGTMVWDIPIGWGPRGTTDNSGQIGVIEGYKQEFVIFSDGFAGVRKFSNQVTRRTNDVVYLNGVLKP